MSSKTSFNVKISNLRGENLDAKDSDGKSDPFLKFNFDNFKTWKTSKISNCLNPVWNDVTEFVYRS